MVSDKIALLNAEYTNVTSGQLLEHIMEDAQAGRKAMAVFLNVDVVMKIEKDPYLKEIVHEAEYVLADGMPLIWFSKLLGTPLKEKISGSDFVPLLCERAAREGKDFELAIPKFDIQLIGAAVSPVVFADHFQPKGVHIKCL